MALPANARYVIRFRPTDVGLAPVFKDALGLPCFQRLDNLAQVPAPSILELGGGRYYFDWPWASESDPDISFVIDGGASIPTPVERYLTGRISAREYVTSSGGGGGGGGGGAVIGG